MKIVMVMGKTGSGKTTLCKAISGQDISIGEMNYISTQTTDIINGTFIDTPGQYIENKWYGSLTIISADCDIMAICQDCTSMENVFPPSFAGIFAKPVIGIITKMDLCEDMNSIKMVEEMLSMAGAETIFKVSSLSKLGFEEIRKYIKN